MIFINKTLVHTQSSVYQALLSPLYLINLLEGPGNEASVHAYVYSCMFREVVYDVLPRTRCMVK